MDDSSFPVEVISGVPVMTAPCELDITNASELETALQSTAPDGTGTLVIDMSSTRFCDSAALRTLLMARTRLRAGGGDLLLVIAGEAVLRVFQITGADRLIRHVASLEEALARTSSGDGRSGD
jgi:anti-sigma B factor antagonist